MDGLIKFTCETCGEPLDISTAKNGVIQCKRCFNSYTLPIKKENLNDIQLAKHHLDLCEFDNAYETFKNVLEEDETEPEAYFGMALASHKIQYLKDVANKHLQPICHDINNKKFIADKDYQLALKYANVEQRKIYQEKAVEIDEIKDEFYNLKQSGLSYDCFICVKVRDENKGFTEDSRIAQDLYYRLKEEGYKPFYSEVEIKNQAGAKYEARILYALYSAKCMLIVCLDENYLRTPWVQNEYTRFIQMINDKSKENDSVTIVFTNQIIEKLPKINGKIQGVQYNNAYAFDIIKSFIEKYKVNDIDFHIDRKDYSKVKVSKKDTIKQVIKKRNIDTSNNALSKVTASDTSKIKMIEDFLTSKKYDLAIRFANEFIKNNPNVGKVYWLLFLASNAIDSEKTFTLVSSSIGYIDYFEKALATSNFEERSKYYNLLYMRVYNTQDRICYEEYITLSESDDKKIDELTNIMYAHAKETCDTQLFDSLIKTIDDTKKYIDMNITFASLFPSLSVSSKYYKNILEVDPSCSIALLNNFLYVHNLLDHKQKSAYFFNQNNFKTIENELFSYSFNEEAENLLFNVIVSVPNDDITKAIPLFDFILGLIPSYENDLFIEYIETFIDKKLLISNCQDKWELLTKYNNMLLSIDKYNYNAYIVRYMINRKYSNYLSLADDASVLFEDENYISATTCYFEKHPNSENIFQFLPDKLKKVKEFLAECQIKQEILDNVFIDKSVLFKDNCVEIIKKNSLNLCKKLFDMYLNELFEYYKVKTVSQLPASVNKHSLYGKMRYVIEFCNDRELEDQFGKVVNVQDRKTRAKIKTINVFNVIFDIIFTLALDVMIVWLVCKIDNESLLPLTIFFVGCIPNTIRGYYMVRCNVEDGVDEVNIEFKIFYIIYFIISIIAVIWLAVLLLK